MRGADALARGEAQHNQGCVPAPAAGLSRVALSRRMEKVLVAPRHLPFESVLPLGCEILRFATSIRENW